MVRLPRLLQGLVVFALLLGLAAPALAAQAKGKIKSVDGDNKEFVLTDNDGTDLKITMAADGKVFINNEEKKVSDLKVGDKADVTYQREDNKNKASLVKATR